MEKTPSLHLTEKIFLTGVDSDIRGLLDYVMLYIINYMIVFKKSTSKSDVVPS